MSKENSLKIPSYRLHKTSGLAVVRLNGKDFYLGKHGSPESRNKYNQLVSEWLTNNQQIPKDIDFHANTISIRDGKSGRVDIIPMHPQLAQKVMRHADYRTTLKHYTVLGLTDTIKAINQLPAIKK